MYISDNIIKHHLKNVYFVSGSACGGKTTATRYLAEKYNMILYNWDDEYNNYMKIANPVDQPAMSKYFKDEEAYFDRPADVYSNWMAASMGEQMEMALVDLIRLSHMGKKIVVDGFFSAQVLSKISDPSRAVFLYAQRDVIERDYFTREEKQGMIECIRSLSHPERALKSVFDSIIYKQDEEVDAVLKRGFKAYVRTMTSRPEDTLKEIEERFDLNK